LRLLDYFWMLTAEGGSLDKGYDFSIVSQVPQNIFQNVSPPAAFVGPSDVHMPLEPRQQQTSLGQVSSDTERDSGGELVKSGPREEEVDVGAETNSLSLSREESPSSAYPPSKSGSEKSISRKDADQHSDPHGKDKSSRGKSSTPLGALQKWFQMSTEHRPSSGSYSTMKQATSVMEASKSLVKERIGAFSNTEKVKPQPQPHQQPKLLQMSTTP
jgi:hypothetical protein